MITLSIKEEMFGTGTTKYLELSLPTKNLTLAGLIQLKTAAELQKIKQQLVADDLSPLSSFLSQKEQVLNEASIKRQKDRLATQIGKTIPTDEEKAGYEALAGFQANAFFVIVDGEQRIDLEEKLHIHQNTDIQFVRLLPLVGG